MSRKLGFVALVVLVFVAVQALTGLGGIIGIWISILLASWLAAMGAARLARHRRLHNEIRALGSVDSPHNRGKLGALLLGEGRPRAALPHLQAAAEGDRETPEWNYRLGRCLLSLRRPEEAAEALGRVVEVDEEYAYGAAQLRRAEALTGSGRADEALVAIDAFDRNHGESAESVYRRGVALRTLGRRDQARDAFARVGSVASGAARYQKGEASRWAMRAAIARWI